jgi:hypothetical protein
MKNLDLNEWHWDNQSFIHPAVPIWNVQPSTKNFQHTQFPANSFTPDHVLVDLFFYYLGGLQCKAVLSAATGIWD